MMPRICIVGWSLSCLPFIITKRRLSQNENCSKDSRPQPWGMAEIPYKGHWRLGCIHYRRNQPVQVRASALAWKDQADRTGTDGQRLCAFRHAAGADCPQGIYGEDRHQGPPEAHAFAVGGISVHVCGSGRRDQWKWWNGCFWSKNRFRI